MLARHKGETICLVAHGGVNRVILFDALGLALSRYYAVSQDYGCLNRLRYFEDGATVVDLVNG
jgi:broad specificity phosphatase PhoE